MYMIKISNNNIKIQLSQYKNCVLRDKKLKLQGKILNYNHHSFKTIYRHGSFNTIG